MKRDRDDDELPLSRVQPVDEDVRRELEFHLEQRTRELMARGLSMEQARAAAREYFGDRETVEAECRTIETRRRTSRRRARRLEALRHDVRLGLRMLRKSPGFTLAATLTLALGIGANTAVFSVVNKLVLQPLAYQDADRLVTLTERHEKGWGSLPWANMLDVEAQSRSFVAMASYASWPVTVLGSGGAMRANAGPVSSGFFRVFPVRPVLGRLPAPDEFRRGANPVAVVSYSFWRDRLGAPGRLAGVHLKIDQDYAVIGVLPAGFDFPDGNEVWVPMELQEQTMSRTSHNGDVIGRLAPRVTAQAAQREVDAILARLKPLYYPDFDAVGSTVTPLQRAMTSSTRTPLFLLLGASAVLLLGACTNLASAMLARGAARSGELAVRSALGASRSRLVRQLLTESVLLSFFGCAAGVGLAALLLRSLVVFAPSSLSLPTVTIDGWVLSFAALVTVLTALMFGLLPALHLSDADTSVVLREGSRGTATTGRIRAWNALVATEVALTVVLISGTTLLVRSFAHVLDTKLGFNPEQVVAGRVDLPAVNYGDSSSSVAAFHMRVLDVLSQQPGVEAAGFANLLPVVGTGPSGSLQVDGKPLDPEHHSNGYAVYRVVGGDFFRAMGIPVLRGRAFTRGDDARAPPVVIVNEAFAGTNWPGEDPIGKRVRPVGMDRSGDEPWYTVVGVVGDTRVASVTQPFRPIYYFDHRQRLAYRTRSVTYALRSGLDPSSVTGTLQRAIASVDPQVPIEALSARMIVSDAVADRRFTMLVLAGFALAALFLAVIGIYAVVAYSVAQRTREIGVRLALGATPGGVRAMIVTAAMRAVIPGLALGACLALASSGALRTLVYGISPTDLSALATAVGVLAASALASSMLPARRATKVDPMIAIRGE